MYIYTFKVNVFVSDESRGGPRAGGRGVNVSRARADETRASARGRARGRTDEARGCENVTIVIGKMA